MQRHELPQVLLVDDDEVDRELVVRSFRRSKVDNPIITARDGQEALDILRGHAGKPPLQPPYVVLLDLNMPRVDGFTFLAELRKDEHLRRTLVFVLTTSDDERDKRRAYDLNVAGYLLKCNVGSDFSSAIELLECYWRSVEFPNV